MGGMCLSRGRFLHWFQALSHSRCSRNRRGAPQPDASASEIDTADEASSGGFGGAPYVRRSRGGSSGGSPLKKPLLQLWQWRPCVLWPQSSHTPPLRRPVASHRPQLKWQLRARPLHLHPGTRRTRRDRPLSVLAALTSRRLPIHQPRCRSAELPRRRVSCLCSGNLPPPSLTPTLARRPADAVGRLPRLVVVERRAALAVLTGGVVPAHALAVDLPFQSTDRKHRFKNSILGLFFTFFGQRRLKAKCVCVCVWLVGVADHKKDPGLK